MEIESLSKEEKEQFEGKSFRCPDCAVWSDNDKGMEIKKHECDCSFCEITFIIECECGYQEIMASFDEKTV